MTRPIRLSVLACALSMFVTLLSAGPGAGVALATADTCGYPTGSGKPATTFSESEVLQQMTLIGAGANTQIAVWYSDEHALTLGVNPNAAGLPVTTMSPTTSPNHAVNPSVGDKSASDVSGRPIYPALFVTDITANPSDTSGDWQHQVNNDNGIAPNDVFGTWKSATKSGSTITPDGDPSSNSSYGAGADTPPSGLSYQSYRAEVRWTASSLGAGLTPGHTYRVQAMVHDGDQNKTGGDSGEACASFTIPTAKLKVDKQVSVNAPAGTYADGPVNAHVGDVLYYQVTVSNTGGTNLSVATTDFSQSCGNGTLYTTPAATTAVTMPQTINAGANATYYCRHTLVPGDLNAPNSDYINTACTSGDYNGFPASGDPNNAALCDTVITHIQDPHLKIDKTQSLKTDGTGFTSSDITAHVGDKIIYKLLVTNTGNVAVSSTTLDPPAVQTGCDGPLRSTIAAGPPVGQPVSIGVGASVTYYCDHTLGAGTSFVNHACVSGDDGVASATAKTGDSLCDTTTTNIGHPGFHVTKTVDKTRAHIGDTLTYTITATNTGDDVLHVSNFDDHVKNTLAAGCTFAAGRAPPATFDLAASGDLAGGDVRSFTCTHMVDANDPNPYTNVACFDATDGAGVTPATFAECGEATTTPLDAVLTITKTVDKAHAYDADPLTYTITVTNTGRATADHVQVTDLINGTNHSCGTLVGPAQGGSLAPGQSLTYTCSYAVQHPDEDSTHHIVNTATVTGNDPAGAPLGPVSASATTLVVHPAIKIEKTGPATAQAGDKIGYVLTVTNPGDEALADATVKVTDAQCNGAPVQLIGKGGDASPGTLDPGDVWTYSCSVQTSVGDTAVHNTALVEGADEFGKVVDSSSAADTTLAQPSQIVLPSRVVSGTAKLLGPTGCAAKAFNARVKGTKIATVTFVLDGKVVKRFKKPLASGSYALRINPTKLRLGVHRLVANVTFQSGTGTKPKTIRLSFQRCGKKLASPRFTG
jgi:uncharacterized repeat protein (TIGR01451 family)